MSKVRRITIALTIAAIGLVSCGDSGGDADEEATASPSSSASAAEREEISIETKVTLPTGEVLAGSAIGDSPFCSGGTFRDDHGNSEVGSVLRTFTCPEGELKIGFTPGEEVDLKQTGPWNIVGGSGSGSFEGLRGNGQMTARFDDDGVTGSETFTGEVIRD